MHRLLDTEILYCCTRKRDVTLLWIHRQEALFGPCREEQSWGGEGGGGGMVPARTATSRMPPSRPTVNRLPQTRIHTSDRKKRHPMQNQIDALLVA